MVGLAEMVILKGRRKEFEYHSASNKGDASRMSRFTRSAALAVMMIGPPAVWAAKPPDGRRQAGLHLPDPEDGAGQRPDGPVGPVRLAGDHCLLHDRPHRLAQRGREGAVGIRPFFRAHDVSRDRRISPGKVQRRAQIAGSGFQRVHQRRLDLLPHDDPRHGPGHGGRDRGRPVPEPQVRRRHRFRRKPGRCWANTTRVRRRPFRS